MAVDFSSFKSILANISKILKITDKGTSPVPAPLIMVGGGSRPGLSATKIASAIIARKSEAGLPTGALPSGGVSPDEIMERIRAEEYIKALHEDAQITVAVPPGTTITASGVCAAGPVTVVGSTITITTAYAVIA